MTARKVPRGARSKPTRTRKPALLPALLRALDARPDVTVVTREWPVVFVQLRYMLEKTVVNPDGMSPLHREEDRFVPYAWSAIEHDVGLVWIDAAHRQANTEGCFDEPEDVVAQQLGPIHPEVAERLGLVAPTERAPTLTGRPMQR